MKQTNDESSYNIQQHKFVWTESSLVQFSVITLLRELDFTSQIEMNLINHDDTIHETAIFVTLKEQSATEACGLPVSEFPILHLVSLRSA
jgi:hypothetical protein